MRGRKLEAGIRAEIKKAITAQLETSEGKRPSWKKVMEEFPGVSRGSFYAIKAEVVADNPALLTRPAVTKRIRDAAQKNAKAKRKSPITKKAREVRAAVAAKEIAVSEPIGTTPIGLLDKWLETFDLADEYIAFARGSGGKDDDGAPVIKHPGHFGQGIALRARVVDTMMKAQAQVWNASRVQHVCEVILRNLRGEDPEVAGRILSQVESAFEEVGVGTRSIRI